MAINDISFHFTCLLMFIFVFGIYLMIMSNQIQQLLAQSQMFEHSQPQNTHLHLLPLITQHFSDRIILTVSQQTNQLILMTSAPLAAPVQHYYIEIVERQTYFTLCFHSEISTNNNLDRMISMINLLNINEVNHSLYVYDANKHIIKVASQLQKSLIQQISPIARKQYVSGILTQLQRKLIQFLQRTKQNKAKDDATSSKQKVNEVQTVTKAQGKSKQILLKQLKKNIIKSIMSKRKNTVKSQIIPTDVLKISNKKNISNSFTKKINKLCEINLKSGQAILKTIKIQNVFNITPLPHTPSNLTSLHLLKANYLIVGASLYQKTNDLISNPDEQLVQKYFNNPIIRKTAIQLEQPSFVTQINILGYLRSSSCESIAQYYVEQISDDHQNFDLYCKYYPFQWNHMNLPPKKRLHTFLMTSLGIAFLSQKSLLHRDLKPQNIMLDEKQIPKIIDFGSAVTSITSRIRLNISYRCNQIFITVRTTRKYNIIFEDLSPQIKQMITVEQFERNQNFDVYAFGVMLSSITGDQNSKEYFSGQIFENVEWLQQRCTQKNPYDRISPRQVLGFLKLIWNMIKETQKQQFGK